MIDILKFIADHSGMNLADALKEAYEQGKRDAQPERKRGKWTLLEECANAGYYCSECRKRVVKEGWSGTVKKIKFCPNCGADMNPLPEPYKPKEKNNACD